MKCINETCNNKNERGNASRGVNGSILHGAYNAVQTLECALGELLYFVCFGLQGHAPLMPGPSR